MRFLRRRWWLLALAFLAAAAVLCAPVRVRGQSMQPALRDGDVLLTVPLWLYPPERWAMVVCEEPDSGARVVKRVAGLPGESVQLVSGDLFVDGARVARLACAATDFLPLVDAAGPELARWFEMGAGGFEEADGEWALRGKGTAVQSQPPLDGYLLGGVERPGDEPAVDLALEVEYELEEPGARLEVSLNEGATRFTLALEDLGRRARLERRDTRPLDPKDPRQIVGQQAVLAEVELPSGRRRGRLFLSNADQVLTAALDGEELFAPVPYAAAAELPLEELPLGLHFEQAAVGGEGPLRVCRLRLGRDLFLAPAGTLAFVEALQLAEDEFFLLGDDPDFSRDSRNYGAVSRSRLRGRPIFRLWPPGPLGWGW